MNILMVALHYHHYTRAIAEEFVAKGHTVTLQDIQPRTLAHKIARTLAPKLWEYGLHRHHRAILRKESGKHYDMVLFIQVHQMRRSTLDRFRAAFSNARFVLYNWDSIANHNYLDHAGGFDDVYTFDPGDAAKHGFKYLPLFCVREFQFPDDPNAAQPGVYFVGNLVKVPRYLAIAEFRAYCESHGIPFKAHLAATPPMQAALVKAGHTPRGLANRSIPQDEFVAMMRSVTTTYDFANHDQTGYTMRVIENLCARRKIITNNVRVLDEAFYSPDRFHVFREGDGYEGVEDFLKTPLAQPDELFEEYRIQAFADHLIRGSSHAIPASSSVTAASA